MSDVSRRLRAVIEAAALVTVCCFLITGCADDISGSNGDGPPEGVNLILASGDGASIDRPAWIDEDTLIFSWNLDPPVDQLWTKKLSGGNPVRFSTNSSYRYLNPSYSPTLNMVAYEVIEDQLTGSNVDATKLNGSVGTRYFAASPILSARFPGWGPDGNAIGYLTSHSAEGPKFEITELDDNNPPRALSNTTEVLFERASQPTRMAWYAPSGGEPFSGKVAFNRIPPSAQNGTEIYYYDFATDNFVHLTSEASGDGINDENPSWSPDGAHIVYSSFHSVDFRRELYAVSVASKTAVRLTFTGADESDPAWSPDGKTIAYISDGDLYTKVIDRKFLPQ
jgi:Tol biopolymer transport system component